MNIKEAVALYNRTTRKIEMLEKLHNKVSGFGASQWQSDTDIIKIELTKDEYLAIKQAIYFYKDSLEDTLNEKFNPGRG